MADQKIEIKSTHHQVFHEIALAYATEKFDKVRREGPDDFISSYLEARKAANKRIDEFAQP